MCMLFVSGISDHVATTYRLDMDLAPKDRWYDITLDVISKHGGWDYSFQPCIDFVNSLFSPAELALLSPVFEKVADHMGDYGEEMRGLLVAFDDSGNSGKVTLGDIMLLNFLYDLSEACTGIVAQTGNGTLIHGRNLDYHDFGLRNISANIDFVSGGEVLFHTTGQVGNIGVYTGMRPHGFSVQLNQRDYQGKDTLAHKLYEMASEIINTAKGGTLGSLLIRETLMAESNYDGAVQMLSDTRLIAPCYYIVGGVSAGQGAVITRDREGPDQSYDRGVWTMQSGDWYILQTNFDNWLAPPADDDRRDAAKTSMAAIGQQGLSPYSLYYNAMSVAPVLDVGARVPTIYTTIMVPSLNYYFTVVRSPPITVPPLF